MGGGREAREGGLYRRPVYLTYVAFVRASRAPPRPDEARVNAGLSFTGEVLEKGRGFPGFERRNLAARG